VLARQQGTKSGTILGQWTRTQNAPDVLGQLAL